MYKILRLKISFFVCYYIMVLISEIGSISSLMGWLDTSLEYWNVSRIGGSNKTMWLSRLLFRQNNVDLNYETRRFNDAHASGRSRNAGVIRIIDDSFPAYMTGGEREKPFGRDRTGSSFACHVTCRSVITRVIDRSRLDWPIWWFARPEKYRFWQLKREIDKDDMFCDRALTLSELFSYYMLINISHYIV